MNAQPATLEVWTSKNCSPCALMKRRKTWEQLASHYGASLVVFDIEEHEEEADRREIGALPTTQLCNAEREVLGEFEGAASLAECIEALEAELARRPSK